MFIDKPYFMENENWYEFDKEKGKYVLKGDVPKEVKDSYIEFYEELQEETNQQPKGCFFIANSWLKRGNKLRPYRRENNMADTVDQANGTVTETQESRTFTQEEVNAIIAERIKRESAKYADYATLQEKASKFDEMEEANKSELQKATEKANALQIQLDNLTKEKEVMSIREKVSSETGVPMSLLSKESEEECMEQAKALLAFKNQDVSSYPSVKDGGEPTNTKTKKSEAELFGEWFKKQI